MREKMDEKENCMSDTNTPAPTPADSVAHGILNQTMLSYLKMASPWLRFMGVMGFIGVGVLALCAVMMACIMPALGTLTETTGYSPLMFRIMGVFYLVLAALYVYPAKCTWAFGTRIRTYLRDGRQTDLELAFRNNKSLWKFYGILTIVGLALCLLCIVASVFIGVYFANLQMDF